MIHYTLGATIAGGINGVASQAAGAVTEEATTISAESAAANYKVTVIRGLTGTSTATLVNKATWASLGGRAIFDTNDPTHKTVLLLPRSDSYTVTAAGATANTDALTMTVYYLDGTAPEAVTATAVTGATYGNVNTALGTAVTGLTITEVTNAGTAGTTEANDTYRVNLTSTATRNGGANNGKTVGHVTINQVGAFSSAKLNAPSTGLVVFAADATGRSNIYKPGDNVIIEVDTTVVDPAGNTVNSSNDDVSANAS